MKVFISWSGDQSEQVALALRDWLPDVIQAIDPWMSVTDIPIGTKWTDVLAQQLNDTGFGIICLTKNNYKEPYILYEAGALAKTIDNNTLVCPYLIDLNLMDLEKSPLSQFQAAKADEHGTWYMIKSINDSLNNISKLSDDRLKKSFKNWWPTLAKRLRELKKDSIYIERKTKSDPKMRIYKLDLLDKNKKLKITWEIFARGIEMLLENIKLDSTIQPDIILGVNESGAMIASYLSCNLDNRARVGIIKTGGIGRSEQREIFQFDLPSPDVFQHNKNALYYDNLKSPKNIVIVDGEIKTGRSIKDIIKFLQEKYKDSKIISITLVGVVEDAQEVKSVYDFGWNLVTEEDKTYKPDFLAYYIEKPGVVPLTGRG